MNAPQLARFLAPTDAEHADQAAEDTEARLRFDYAERVALAAMQAGVAAAPVDRVMAGKLTLADMLSEHTCSYRTDIEGSNPCDLLAVLVAEALARKCPAAQAYAARIAKDYAVSQEVA